MTRKSVLRIAFHGTLLIVLGMLVGLPFVNAITGGSGPEVVRAWRVAHTSLVTAGTLYIAVAAVGHHLVLSARSANVITGSLVTSAYAFAFAFVVGPAVGARGLEPSGPALHLLVFAILAASLLATFVATLLVLRGLYAAMRSA
jgi:hypothetical protein